MAKEHVAAVTESSLQRLFNFFAGRPNLAKTNLIEVVMKPLAPTLIVSKSTFHWVSQEMSSASGVYLLCFLTTAA